MSGLRSAGILLFRRVPVPGVDAPRTQVWIAHMGGPFWARKDAAAWSIPKGLYSGDETALAAALREFAEEMGTSAPTLDYRDLGEFRQSSGKVVTAFAAEADFELDEVRSNTFEVEWPPRSGSIRSYPEIDRAGWFDLDEARVKLVKGQVSIIDALETLLA